MVFLLISFIYSNAALPCCLANQKSLFVPKTSTISYADNTINLNLSQAGIYTHVMTTLILRSYLFVHTHTCTTISYTTVCAYIHVVYFIMQTIASFFMCLRALERVKENP